MKFTVQKAAPKDKNAVISAYWPSTATAFSEKNFTLSIGEIQFFLKHTLISIDGKSRRDHIIAYVHWFKRHQNYTWFGSSAVVCNHLKEDDNICAFIPMQRISDVCIYGIIEVSFTAGTNDNILVAIPMHYF